MSDLVYKPKKSEEVHWNKLPFTHTQNSDTIHVETIKYERHKYKYISLRGRSTVVSGYYKCQQCNKEILLWSDDNLSCTKPKYYYLSKANVDPIEPLCSQVKLDEAIEKSISNIKKYIKKVSKIIHVPYSTVQGTSSVSSQAISKLLLTKEVELYFLPNSRIEYIKLKPNDI